MPSAQSQKCTTHSSTEQRSKSQSFCPDVVFRKPLHQRAEGQHYHRAIGSRTTLTAAMDVVDGDHEEEARLAHTDHRLWTDHHVTARHRAECLPEDTGLGAEGEVVAVEEEDTEGVHDHTRDLGAARRVEACHALLTAARRPELHRDEAMVGGTAHRGEEVVAAEALEAEEGEALATAPTVVTAAGVGIADRSSSFGSITCRKRNGRIYLVNQELDQTCVIIEVITRRKGSPATPIQSQDHILPI